MWSWANVLIMKGLDKKSNAQLLELRFKLGQDFYRVKEETIKKYDHMKNIEKVYNSINEELKNRGVDV
jgi:ribosome biogenesis protein Tsr3